jgi:hypothetical protein
MSKYQQGDLIIAKYGIPYETGEGAPRMIKNGTPGVIIKKLTGGQCLTYFHNYPVILLGDTRDIRRR